MCLSIFISFIGGLLINKSHYPNFVLLLTILTVWLLGPTLVVNKRRSYITLIFIAVSSSVIMAIKTKSLLLFYVFFEFSIIPIIFIIFTYGYQPEKLQATLSLLLYTIVGRLPLLIVIVKNEIRFTRDILLLLPLTLAFMIKSPMYLLHIWLPKAHVEAPVGGSILLAGVLLKLGSYGLLLFLPMTILSDLHTLYLSLSIVGGIVGSLICSRQGDLKILIAYSSVVHMGVVTLGFIRGSELGYICGIMMVFGHGIASPFLFAMSFWLYCNSHSRLMVNRIITLPIVAFLLFALVSLNIGVPPSLGLWSEVLITIASCFMMGCVWPFLVLLFLFGVLYNLFLYVSCTHAKFINTAGFLGLGVQAPMLQAITISYGSLFSLDLFHL